MATYGHGITKEHLQENTEELKRKEMGKLNWHGQHWDHVGW